MNLKRHHFLRLSFVSLLCIGSSWVVSGSIETARANWIAQGSAQPSPATSPESQPTPTSTFSPEAQPTPTPKESPTPPQDSKPSIPVPPKPLSDYDRLQQALSQRKDLKEADRLTYQLMLRLAGSKSLKNGRFDLDEWRRFPCSELRKIDQFWQEATDGNHGFTAQYKIFQEIQGKSREEKQLNYYVKIGWRSADGEWLVFPKYNSKTRSVEYVKEPNFKDPPPGHLPARLGWEDMRDHRLQRIGICGL